MAVLGFDGALRVFKAGDHHRPTRSGGCRGGMDRAGRAPGKTRGS